MSDLDFEHEEHETGGSKRPTKVVLKAMHPEHGQIGHLTYHVPRRKADKIYVDRLEVDKQHQGNGYASQLMDEMQRRHPGTPIDHGDRTDDGKGWWAGYTKDKKVTKGRTMASRTASGHPTRESVHNIVHNFAFADGDSWDEVKANYDTSHPSQRKLRQDIKDNGIREPIKIDYDQSPPEVVDGHTRLMHAESLGHTHVPVEHSTFADAHYYASLRTASGWSFEHFQSNEPGLHRIFGQPPGGEPRQHHLMYQTKPGNKLKFDDFTVDRLRNKGGDEAVHRLQQAALDHHPGHTLYTPEDDKPAAPEKPKRRTYYHGTTASDVTHILPASHHGQGVIFPHVTDRDYAYASEDPKDAWNYAEKAYDVAGGGDRHPRVYQVRPIGGHQHVEKDPEWDHVRNVSRGNNESDRRSKKGWEVVREMKMPKHMGKPEDWHEGGEKA